MSTPLIIDTDVALGAWVGQPGALCIFAPTCGSALAMEHNGDVYACDHYVEPDYHLGNIRQDLLIDLVASPAQEAFGLAKRDTLPSMCRTCDVRFACHGGCPRNRFIKTPDGEAGLNYLCAGYIAFFRHVDKPMQVMARALSTGEAPALVMAWTAEQDRRLIARFAGTGRNDPCPCGSGRKFKRCHGRSGAL